MAFAFYSPYTINSGQVPSAQSDFPVLVSVTDARFKTTGNGGHVENSSGFDIRPYSDSALTTAITGYELERYNASTGEVVMWVKRSSVSDGLVTYLAYGDAALNTDGSSTTTWSNNFMSVQHLKDGSTLSVANSTGLGTNATNNGATATTGKINGGASFVSASSQYIYNEAMHPTAITLSSWVNATSFPNSYNSTIARVNTNNYSALYVRSTGKLACYTFPSGDVSYDGTGSHTLSAGTTYYLVMTYDSSAGLVGYVNAASDGTAAANGTLQTAAALTYVGADPLTGGRFWNGMIDEARVASVARSTDWITTEYNNQSAPGTFATLGTESGVGAKNRRTLGPRIGSRQYYAN